MARILRVFTFQLEVQDRAHVQQPTEAWAYQVPVVPCFSKMSGEPRGVIGKVLERHRAVLHEGDGLSFALHGHHDVQAGLAHLPDGLLEGGVGGLDDRPGLREAEARP